MVDGGASDRASPQGRMRRIYRRLPFLNTSDIRLRLGELIFLLVIIILIAVTGFAACINVAKKGWNADAASWAQAAGSIIAVAGASWLAQSSERHARRWRRQQGEEATWSARFIVMQAKFEAQIIAAELTKPSAPFDVLDVRNWLQRSANVSLALKTMLGRTDYSHPAVIVTICNAKILVDHLSSNLVKLEDAIENNRKPCDQTISDVIHTHVNLSALLDQFDGRLKGIREALDRGHDMLPVADFYD